jgi:hypothetical protein
MKNALSNKEQIPAELTFKKAKVNQSDSRILTDT